MTHPNYNQHRPYRDRLIQIHQQHNHTTFTHHAQLWTLGGPEHHEYAYLTKHLHFAPNSYHTIDRGPMHPTTNLTNPHGITTHPHTEFKNAHHLWHNPIAISYDSTQMITPGAKQKRHDHTQDNKITDLIRWTKLLIADSNHPILFIHANYMLAYPGTRTTTKHGLFFANDYTRWTSLYIEQLKPHHTQWTGGTTEHMHGTKTEMIDLHFIITRNPSHQ